MEKEHAFLGVATSNSARRGSGTTRVRACGSSQERSGVGPPRKRQDYPARRLPGPAGCRLSDGDLTPEALFELFQDWQRTQTQSSVTTLRGLRQRMDVRFCEGRNHRREAQVRAADTSEYHGARSSEARVRRTVFSLDKDLHGRRQLGS